MKQLYTIGIAVAVILLLLLGLNKLSQPGQTVDPMLPEDDSLTEVDTDLDLESLANEEGGEVLDEETTIDTSNETSPMPEAAQTAGNRTVVMETNKGSITIELFTRDMPITAGNFLTLAEQGYYDGIKFHRVIDGFMIQGGDPLTKDDANVNRWGTGGPGYAIEDEFVPGFSNIRGTLSMANSGPNSGGSQFFINTADNINLDFDKQPLTSKHPVFGRVVSGMDVVDTISKVATGARDIPTEPVVIQRIVVQ
jgi:peptidylprolyl isomerase